MRRQGRVVLLAALTVAGVAAGIFVPGGGATAKAPNVTHVTVAATDSKFMLSRHSAPTGTVIFTVTNRGRIAHDFKIAGKKTPPLLPGHSATLRVTFSKKGRYPYLSTVAGQAAAGMKGVFSVGPAAVAPTPTQPAAPTTTTAPAAPTTTRPVGTANTTVTVDMFDTGGPPHFQLSQATMPSGMVTFEITNKCADTCSFNLEGIKAGTLLNPGQSETWTVALPPGTYRYHCDAAPQLMNGSLTVTP
jgi:plastocyanin